MNKSCNAALWSIIKIGVCIAFLAFLALTVFVIVSPPGMIDKWFSLEIQEHTRPGFDWLMKAISLLGEPMWSIIIALFSALLFLINKYKKEALFVMLTLLSGMISSVVKYLVNRPRPSKDLVRIIEVTQQQSFPSGHVMFYTIYFGFLIYLMYYMKTLPSLLRLTVSTISGLFIVMVSISRIYLGAHWFTDVLGGYLLGLVCLYGLIGTYRIKYRSFNILM